VGAVERDEFLRAAWRVTVAGLLEPQRLVFVDEMGTNTSLYPLYAWSKRGERARMKVPRNRGPNTTLLASLKAEGMGPCMAVVGSTTREVFEVYVERVLAPSLRSGQIVVMDNLTAHKGDRVSELIEERGFELLDLPPYSPDFNPIEEAFPRSRDSCEKLRLGPEKRWWRRWVRQSRRSQHKTPVVTSSTPATVYRSNRCDHLCTPAQLTSPPLTSS
jgi:transposase